MGNFGKGVEKVYKSFLKTRCRDITLKLYKNARHEILNETNKFQVYKDTIEWIHKKMNE